MSSRSLRWTEEQYAELTRRAPAPVRQPEPVALAPVPKKSKYGNRKTEVDGILFDSKKEAARYSDLKLLRAAGDVLWFTTQVPFRLPGGTKWVADFLVMWSSGKVTIEDAKGMRTDVYKIKKREVEHHFGFGIVEI